MTTQRKICIDAGHYGKYNRSPVVPEFYESDRNWKLHLLLKQALERYGFAVITTRDHQDKDLELVARGKAGAGCDLFLSVHANYSSDAAEDYPLACVQVSGQTDDLGQKLADTVHRVMSTRQAGRIYKREGKNGDYYGVLRGAAQVGTPGIILEHSFYTNENAAQWLMVDENLAKLAEAEAQVIATHFGTERSAPKPYTLELPQCYRGCKGELVKGIQALLIARGCSCGTAGADGSFGPDTDKAVRSFQAEKNLKVDGYVGRDTMSALLGSEVPQ